MNWQEKKTKKRQGVRFRSGATILALFLLVITFGIFQKIPWDYAGKFVEILHPQRKLASYEYPLAPIPSSDPILKLTNILATKNIQIRTAIQASGSAMIVTLQEGTTVIISKEKKIEEQVSSLQIILSRLTIEGKKATKIDFRYDMPIISY